MFPQKYPLQYYIDFAHQYNGEFLSINELNYSSERQYEWKCQYNHSFKMSLCRLKQEIQKYGEWCPTCRYNSRVTNKREYWKEEMKKYGFTIMSTIGDEDKPSQSTHILQCNNCIKEIEIKGSLLPFIKRLEEREEEKRFCNMCYYKKKGNIPVLTLRIVKDFILEYGGEIVSYSHNQMGYVIRCKNGHLFHFRHNDLRWCPICEPNEDNSYYQTILSNVKDKEIDPHFACINMYCKPTHVTLKEIYNEKENFGVPYEYLAWILTNLNKKFYDRGISHKQFIGLTLYLGYPLTQEEVSSFIGITSTTLRSKLRIIGVKDAIKIMEVRDKLRNEYEKSKVL